MLLASIKSLYARLVFWLIRPALVHLEHEEIYARNFIWGHRDPGRPVTPLAVQARANLASAEKKSRSKTALSERFEKVFDAHSRR